VTSEQKPSPTGGNLVGFKRHLRAEVVPGEATYLFSERGVSAIRGAQLEELAPLLDGTRDLPTLVSQAHHGGSGHDVRQLLDRLSRAGVLECRSQAPADDRQSESAAIYWGLAGLDGAVASSRSEAGLVRLLTVGEIDIDSHAPVLAAAGLRLTTGPVDAQGIPGSHDLTVVLCDDYLDDELERVDAEQRASGRSWLLAKPVGTELWIGPFFQPGGPCWHCLAHRLRGHRRAEVHVQRALGRNGPAARPMGSLPALEGLGARLVALEAVKWLAGYRYEVQQTVWVMDSLLLKSQTHPLRARPQCPSCGNPDLVKLQTSRPVVPRSRPKASCGSGGHRAAPPEDVLAQYSHLVSPITGVVKGIQRDQRGPAFLNAFRSGPNVANGPETFAEISAGLRSENGGKGVTATHAQVGALCEALERHCAHFEGDELRIRASYRSLGGAAVHPDSCQLYHEEQLRDRDRWNREHEAMHYVVEPFNEDAEIDWTPVWSLTQQRQRLMPTSLLYFRTPLESGRRYVSADSNGNASGSSLEDALVHGFLELVERDAASIWWYNRTSQPAMDVASFADPWIDEMRMVYSGLGREMWALDITSDLGIPTVVALSRRISGGPEDIMLGFGCHFDPAVALRRALSELNQMLPFVVEARPDGTGYGTRAHELVEWWSTATVANQPYLRPDEIADPRSPWDYSYIPRMNLADDIEAITSLMATHGMELMVLDQTRPDIGMPVVKAIVPSLRAFRARFAPGRLYDVPVKLGRVPAPRTYSELNPIPMFV
jgi:oxazoline/thiazoline synthase